MSSCDSESSHESEERAECKHPEPANACNTSEGLQVQWQYMVMQENAMLRNTVAQLHAMLLARDVQNKELQVEFDRLLNDFKDHVNRQGGPTAGACAQEDLPEKVLCEVQRSDAVTVLKANISERDEEIDNLKR